MKQNFSPKKDSAQRAIKIPQSWPHQSEGRILSMLYSQPNPPSYTTLCEPHSFFAKSFSSVSDSQKNDQTKVKRFCDNN